jgi:signal transduction histidine kinase
MKSMSQKVLLFSFGVLVLALIANASIAYRATLWMIENQRWVAHTQEVMLELAAVLSAVQDAETGQRGYIITGSPPYLEPYRRALGVVDEHLAALQRLTADNPRQQARLRTLEPRIAARLRILGENVELRRTAGWEAAREAVASGRGRQEMDAIRGLVAQMTAEERGLLGLRLAESLASGRRALATFTFANLLLLGLTILSFFLVRRHLSQRLQTERELEEKVRARTAELAEANDRLTGFTGDLERSNRELQDFAFIASHDLQEPLRKIQAFGDRLQRKHGAQLGDEGRDYLARMQGAAQRMHTLINDLLTFSRVTSKAEPFVPVELGRIAREVLTDLEVRVQQTGGEVEVGELPTLEAAPLQMRQLFQNLIGNALKFHREGVPPRVRVAAREIDRGDGAPVCELTFEDNGIGFDTKYLDRIFTPFQRLHGRVEYEGTGMGLAVCRRIVERHRGEITAESVPGQGARFLIVLPLRQRPS